MKIVFISSMAGAPWGGSEELWSRAASRLAEDGCEVFASVVKWPKQPGQISNLKAVGVQITERVSPKKKLSARIASLVLRQIRGDCAAINRWIDRVDPDLVCLSNGSYADDLGLLEACAFSGRPFVSIAQANSEHWWPQDETAEKLINCFERAKRCFFVSQGNLDLFKRQLGWQPPHAEIVSNPFNVSWSANPAWLDTENGFKLAFVARLDPAAKGHDILFEVLAQTKWRQRPLEVSLFGHGPCEGILKRLIRSNGLAESVRFTGYVENVEAIWAAHHALILPSRFEGLPLALVEAMLCGRTAIVTDVAGNAELLQDNITGFVAAGPNCAALDEAMERAWQRRHEWNLMGAAAASHIRKVVPQDPVRAFADRLLELSSLERGMLAEA